MSETSHCRDRLSQYCVGYGLDLGYGGDPIIPSAITLDLPKPYTNVGNAPLNLGGDARNLFWFSNESLDYVFSSHLLEDFETDETGYVIIEWLRVLKVGGNLILYLPDEQRYRRHCKNTGQKYNAAHKNENFSLAYIKQVLQNIPNVEIIYEDPLCEDYSFDIVIKKRGPTMIGNSILKQEITVINTLSEVIKKRTFIIIIMGMIIRRINRILKWIRTKSDINN